MRLSIEKILKIWSLILISIGASLLIFSFFQSAENIKTNENPDAKPRKPTFAEQTFNPRPQAEKEQFQIPILMFHYIKDIPANSKDQLGYRLSYSPQKLEELLQFLQENKIETITHRDLKAAREGIKPLPKKSIMLTFDDGHKEHFEAVLPLLKKYQAKGVFFVITGKADKDPLFLNRAEIKALAEAGNEIWSHTISHPNLTNLGLHSLQEEIAWSKKALEDQLQIPIISFCYPAGRYNNTALKLVKTHYLFARATQGGTKIWFKKRRTMPTIRIFPRSKAQDLKKYRPEK